MKLAALATALLGLASPGAAAAAIPPAPGEDFYGVTSATSLTSAELERMADGGLATLRLPFYWPHIESQPPSEPAAPLPTLPGEPVDFEDESRFEPTDRIVLRAARNGIRVLPFVYGTPSWLTDDPERPPLDDAFARASYQRFLSELVARYGPGGELWRERASSEPELAELAITNWQVWNEPNSPVFWTPRPSPREYAELVALASQAIRAVDPSAGIVLAGMFGTPSNGPRAWRFLERFHTAGAAAGSFDAYAVHPYAPNLPGIRLQMRRTRRAIEAGPAPAAPIWVTEIGWPTDGPKGFDLVKTPRGQKRLLGRSYRLLLAKAERWRVAKIVWFVWRDNDVQADCTLCRYSGLFTERLEPKPAWRKLTRFAGGVP